jgi:hypothetical protein
MKYPTSIPLPYTFRSIFFVGDATQAYNLHQATCNQHKYSMAWYLIDDMIHSMLSHDLIGSSITTMLALHHWTLVHRCQVLALALPPHGASHLSSDLPFTLATILRSQAMSLDLLHLATWHHVMSHMQWAPPINTIWTFQQIQATSPPWLKVAHTSVPVD